MPARRTALDWILEGAALLVLCGTCAWLAMQWANLPDSVPKEYSLAGSPNAWGSKEVIWLLPILAAGIYTLISVLGGKPSVWNLPAGVDRNLSEVQAVILRLLAVLKLTVMAVFAYISFIGINVSLGHSSGLGSGFLPAVLAITALPPLYYGSKLRRLRQ